MINRLLLSPKMPIQRHFKRSQKSGGWVLPLFVTTPIAAIVLSSGLNSSSSVAVAQSVGTLPPPPTVRGLESTPQSTNSLPFVPIDKTFQAPMAPAEVGSTGYRVLVNGDSRLLLQQVQRIEPKAFLAQYRGRNVIQVGVFSNETNARQQADQVRSQGIEAEVVGAGSSSSAGSSNTARSSGYRIAIPGGKEELSAIRSRILQLGADPQNVSEKTSPYGPHVELGPFSDRKTAEEWNRLLRSSGGLDARVYYAR